MTPRGGAMVIGTDNKYELQMLTANGAPAGKRRALAWGPDFPQKIVAIQGGFLAIGSVMCERDECATWAWIGADGKARASEQVTIGRRQLSSVAIWHTDDVVHVLAQSPPQVEKPDLWIQLTPGRDGSVAVVTHEVDIAHSERLYFMPDGERSRVLASKGYGKTRTMRWANSDGKSGAVTGWAADLVPITGGPGGRILAYSDATKTREWVDLRLEPDGKLVELSRGPAGVALPKPYVEVVTADEDTRDGITMYRHSSLGEVGKPLLLTGHMHPIPGDVAASAGRFFATYGEIGARTLAIKLAAVTCR